MLYPLNMYSLESLIVASPLNLINFKICFNPSFIVKTPFAINFSIAVTIIESNILFILKYDDTDTKKGKTNINTSSSFYLMFDVPYRFSGLAFQDFQICVLTFSN